MSKPSFLIVSYPLQGHITPALRLAHRLSLLGAAHVAFVTTISALLHHTTHFSTLPPPPDALTFAPFSDGDDASGGESSLVHGDDYQAYYAVLRRRGTQALAELIGRRPFTCLVYTPLFHWAADVAAEHNVPSAMLWVQAATVFDVIYYYFFGFTDAIAITTRPDREISLPGVPIDLAGGDLPSYMVNTSDNWFYANLVGFLKEQFEKVNQISQRRSVVLVNTFEALEAEALGAVSAKLDLIAIGPLVHLDPHIDRYRDGTIFEWLSSKPAGSVVYVAFGSVADVSGAQIEEIAKGLLGFGQPFLWVLREEEKEEKVANICREELDKLGIIVPWCDQIEVLDNPALGCFVSHCGWNSTLESMACGVPIVAFPHFVDQPTNAKLVEGFWRVGVRVKGNEVGIVESGEIMRCLGLVMERKGFWRTNAKKWKGLARDALKEGGSLDKNLKAFVDQMINIGDS